MLTQSQWIVGFWFLPGFVFLLLPLCMLAVWSIVQAVKAMSGQSESARQGRKEENNARCLEKLQPSEAA